MLSESKYSFLEVKSKMEVLCAYQERCAFDLNKKMTSWKVPMEDQEAILAHLISHNFLNEERFAEAYTSGKVNIKKWGKIKIKQHLSQKRISDYSIKKALENIDLEAYSRNISSLAEKKYYSLSKEPNSYKKKTKIYRYFASKGYETDLFKPVVDELFVSS